MWNCAQCRENIEPQFRYCWNCGTRFDGQIDPFFVAEPALANRALEPHVPPQFGLRWMFVTVTGCAVIFGIATIADFLPASLNDKIAAILFLFMLGLIAAVTVNVSLEIYLRLKQHFEDQSNATPRTPTGRPGKEQQDIYFIERSDNRGA